MFTENIKTENDAREALVEKILEITEIIDGVPPSRGNSDSLEGQRRFYEDLRNYVKREFSLDTSPYDNIVNRIFTEAN